MSIAEQTPVVYRKQGSREIRFARAAMAREAIGEIRKGQDVFILTFGQFSLIDAVVHVLDEIGPAAVDLSTWTAADADLQRSAELMESARIRSLRLIVDRSFAARQPGYTAHMRRLFGGNCIREIRSHAKFVVLRSDTMDVVIRTSMNLNQNRRCENIEISEDAAFAVWLSSVVDDVFSEVGEGDARSAMLELRGRDESYPFQEIDAMQIVRSSLNEPRTSHTVRKL